MQDHPQGCASNDNIEEHDDNKSKENLSELTKNFPHLFSAAGKNNSARDKKACRVPK